MKRRSWRTTRLLHIKIRIAPHVRAHPRVQDAIFAQYWQYWPFFLIWHHDQNRPHWSFSGAQIWRSRVKYSLRCLWSLDPEHLVAASLLVTHTLWQSLQSSCHHSGLPLMMSGKWKNISKKIWGKKDEGIADSCNVHVLNSMCSLCPCVHEKQKLLLCLCRK